MVQVQPCCRRVVRHVEQSFLLAFKTLRRTSRKESGFPNAEQVYADSSVCCKLDRRDARGKIATGKGRRSETSPPGDGGRGVLAWLVASLGCVTFSVMSLHNYIGNGLFENRIFSDSK